MAVIFLSIIWSPLEKNDPLSHLFRLYLNLFPRRKNTRRFDRRIAAQCFCSNQKIAFFVSNFFFFWRVAGRAARLSWQLCAGNRDRCPDLRGVEVRSNRHVVLVIRWNTQMVHFLKCIFQTFQEIFLRNFSRLLRVPKMMMTLTAIFIKISWTSGNFWWKTMNILVQNSASIRYMLLTCDLFNLLCDFVQEHSWKMANFGNSEGITL